MADLEAIAASLNQLLATYGVTRDQIADLLGGTPDGGPHGDGSYPVTLASGTTVFIPCPRRLAAMSGDISAAVAAIQPILDAANEARSAAEEHASIANAAALALAPVVVDLGLGGASRLTIVAADLSGANTIGTVAADLASDESKIKSAPEHAALARKYANADTDAPIAGVDPADRGAKYWFLQAASKAVDAKGYADAISVIKVNVPGYAFALWAGGYGLPFLIPDDFSKVLLAGRDIANQITVSTYVSSETATVIMDSTGRIARLSSSTTTGTVDQYAQDVTQYASTGYEPIKIIPAVLPGTNTSTHPDDRGGAQNRIQSIAISPSGRTLLTWEGRTGGDFDPKDIRMRLGQISAGGVFQWDAGAPVILGTDNGGWVDSSGGGGQNAFGNPTAVWDKVEGHFKLLLNWRRGDVPNGDNSTTAANGADTTTRLYGLTISTFGEVRNWDGAAFTLGSGRAGMTDLTAAKPPSWGSISPGPGKGLCTLLGNVYFQAHGWDAGDGSINPRSVVIMKLNRTTRRLELFAQTPTTYKPNESGLAEDESTATAAADGNLVLDSRSLGEDRRIVNTYTMADGTWSTVRDATRVDPQAAGDIATLTGASTPALSRPYRTVTVNNISLFGNGGSNGGAGERRGLTICTGYQGGKAGSAKAKRRIYDQITIEQQDSAIAGNVVTETVDCYGKPLATPGQRKLYTGYPVLGVPPNAPGFLLCAFETQLLAPDRAAISAIAIAVVPFPQLFQVRP